MMCYVLFRRDSDNLAASAASAVVRSVVAVFESRIAAERYAQELQEKEDKYTGLDGKSYPSFDVTDVPFVFINGESKRKFSDIKKANDEIKNLRLQLKHAEDDLRDWEASSRRGPSYRFGPGD